MREKLVAMLSLLLAALTLCGCGGIFDKEYVQIEDYHPTVQENSDTGERVTVRNFSALKQAIRSMVTNGETEGNIIFDAAYDGDTTEDMASACWQVRTQDALCAYCVNNIAYELSKIVTYYEAKVIISYASTGVAAEDIVKIPYSTGLERLIETALEESDTQLVVLINRSSLSAEDMENSVARVYREKPGTAPKMPTVSVNMYSGSNMQRLYEVNLRYGMTTDELSAKKTQMAAVQPFTRLNIDELDEAERALAAYQYLIANCEISSEGQGGNIYGALVGHSSDSEGAALAYVELCRQLKVDCRVVYGQRAWHDHCWNIVRVNGEFYHVDAGLENASPEANFLKPDWSIWENYRWDVSSYPPCDGELSYSDVIAEDEPDVAGEDNPTGSVDEDNTSDSADDAESAAIDEA
ncbi:MAG: transglutaminase domain-containing protein [Oscillospiraceae bacterium]|nr:transglutaminase domain-containing protein [Oscillospiraceae bacterium]